MQHRFYSTPALLTCFVAHLLAVKSAHTYFGSEISKKRSAGFLSGNSHKLTLSWAVKLDPSESNQQNIISELKPLLNKIGLTNKGRILPFGNYFLLNLPNKSYARMLSTNSSFNSTVTDKKHEADFQQSIISNVEHFFDSHAIFQWYMLQIVRPRIKRAITFNDPVYLKQWHLKNRQRPGWDINVTGVWSRGITGTGVKIVVVDDGLEWTNPDILPNYYAEGSWDLNSNDPDPMPHPTKLNNHHGTRCAGEIAAVANNHFCAVGVAFNASIAGIRLLDGPLTDSLEAKAFLQHINKNDIYSCSWGPTDNGKTVEGPHYMATKALRYGVEFGRGGYGTIYVVASGNGGYFGDNCGYDGYANAIYTVTIVGERI